MSPKKKKNEINRIISTMCSLQHIQLNKKQCTTMLNSVITKIRKTQLVNFMPEGSNRFGQHLGLSFRGYVASVKFLANENMSPISV